MFSEAELNRMYRYSLTLTNNEAVAYDLLQDGLESFLRKQKNQTIKKPLNYLRRIIRNRFIDLLRSEQRNPISMVEDLDDYQVTEIGFQNLEDIQINQQTLKNIWIRLQPFERELLHFWAVEGWTAKEIAHIQDTPRGTVLARIHRLRKKIAEFNTEDNTREAEKNA